MAGADTSLLSPPSDLGSRELPSRTVHVNTLCRIHRTGEPFFGRSGGNRFDDSTMSYGVCYLGAGKIRDAVTVAFAESVLHDRTAANGGFDVAVSELTDRQVVRFANRSRLMLADLTGAALKRIGLDGRISTLTPYDVTQAWSRAIHAHPNAVDGIAYVSRHYNLGLAIALFDRAAAKLGTAHYTSLPTVRSYASLLRSFAIRPY
jgi:hypothetical protein